MCVFVLFSDDKQNEPKSHLELIAEMRDYKRRRQSYRAKNVHITKKSYTEVNQPRKSRFHFISNPTLHLGFTFLLLSLSFQPLHSFDKTSFDTWRPTLIKKTYYFDNGGHL